MIAARWPRRIRTTSPANVALLALLLAALGVRVYGFNWDDGKYLHPDERHVADIASSRIRLAWPPDFGALNVSDPHYSGLNPRPTAPDDPDNPLPLEEREALTFAYGALPLIVTNGVGLVVSEITGRNWNTYSEMYKVGRSISMLLDTATVFLVYLIGARVGGRRAGLIAAAVAAGAPMSIQLAHFFTTDSWLTFFVTLCLYLSIRAAETGERRWFLAAGVAFGLAMATKGSVFTLAGLLGAAVVYDAWRRLRDGEPLVPALGAAPERIALAGIGALVAFGLFEPYALLRPEVYRKSLEEQADIVRGVIDVPFTRQYIGTTPVVYQVEQFVRWGFGPVAGVLALAGIPLLAWLFWRRRTAALWLLLSWVLGYGLVIALPETKFLRYLAPLTPALAVTAGLALDGLWRLLARRVDPRVAALAGGTLLAGIALWTAAYASIYAHENTRLEASRWIYANVPPGSAISSEHWDDALPMGFGPGLEPHERGYQNVSYELYRDYTCWCDLQALAAALVRHPETAEVADLISAGDYLRAADQLRLLADRADTFSPALRGGLAADLETAADAYTPTAGFLEATTRDLAEALRAQDEAGPDRFRALGDAVAETGDNEAANVLYANLERTDYYVLSSNRVAGSVDQLPWRYPVQIRFYELLASGELGFTLVKDISRHPGLGPLEFDDDSADESWLNYDHPHVLIYRKDALAPPESYRALMADARAEQVSPTRYAPAAEPLTLDEPVGERPAVNDARWSAAVTGGSLGALAVWLGLLAVLQLVGWPLASLAFGRFADAGWGLARPVALLTAGYLMWLGASLRVVEFRAVWCWAALLLVAAAGWGARWRWRRSGLWRARPGQSNVALGAEAVFLAVFALFLLFRYLNPDSYHPSWGGEKPMEFAHLNATLRSAYFPPLDPWYAQGYINYYYYGLYLVAFCLKLTGIPSEIAFNLAQPTLIALLASAGYSIAATLGRDAARRARLAVPAGVLGAVLLVLAGNLDAFFRWVQRPPGYPEDRRFGEGFGFWTWDPSRAVSNVITEFPYFTGLYADLHAHVVALPMTVLAIGLGYALLKDARQLPVALAWRREGGRERAAVGSRLGLLALVVGSLMATNAWDVPTYLAVGGLALLMATAAIRPLAFRLAAWLGLSALVGAVAYGLFLPFHSHYVAIFSSVGRVEDPTAFWEFAVHFGGLLGIVGVGLVVALLGRGGAAPALPILAQPVIPLLLVAGILAARSLAASAGSGTALADGLTVAFVVVLAALLAAAVWSARFDPVPGLGADAELLKRLGLGAALVAVGGALLLDRHVLALLLAVAGAAVAVWLAGANRALRYVGGLVAAGALVGAGVEIVYVADNLAGGDSYRMNTVFKFYNQLWVLFALAGAALVARMAGEVSWRVPATAGRWMGRGATLGVVQSSAGGTYAGDVGPMPRPEEAEAAPPAERTTAAALTLPERWSRAGLGLAALLVLMSLFYPLLATMPRLEQRFADHLGSGTLDANDWMGYGTINGIAYAEDRAVIDWFNEEVDGTPVIAEANLGPYRDNGTRITVATGLPNVVGWTNHQSQQRTNPDLYRREDDVNRLYTAADPAEKVAILRRYDVEYVVVGQIEREFRGDGYAADPAGIAAFEGMVGTSLEVAFRAGETVVYRVLPESAA